MELTDLQQLFVYELKDIYSAEHQILKALPKLIKATSNDELSTALTAKGVTYSPVGQGFHVDALPVDVGRIAADNRIVLTDLRPVEGGLEDLFLELTSDTQRDDLTHAPAPTGASL
jgi:hypothetical protein